MKASRFRPRAQVSHAPWCNYRDKGLRCGSPAVCWRRKMNPGRKASGWLTGMATSPSPSPGVASSMTTARLNPLRMRGSLNELLGLAEDSAVLYAEVNFEILQGAAKSVRIQVPPNLTINQVSGALVADWQAGKPGELTVTFLEPVEQQARFVINGETHTPRAGQ